MCVKLPKKRSVQKKKKKVVLWSQLSIVWNLPLKALVLWRWISFPSVDIRMTSVAVNKQWLVASERRVVAASRLRNRCTSAPTAWQQWSLRLWAAASTLQGQALSVQGLAQPQISSFPPDLKYLWMQLGKITFCLKQSAQDGYSNLPHSTFRPRTEETEALESRWMWARLFLQASMLLNTDSGGEKGISWDMNRTTYVREFFRQTFIFQESMIFISFFFPSH